VRPALAVWAREASRPVPPAFVRFAGLGAGLAARRAEDVLAFARPFRAVELFRRAAGAGFRAFVEPFLPFFGAALRGAFFAIGFSLTERP